MSRSVTSLANASRYRRGFNHGRISEDFDLIKGKAQTFKWKVEGDKCYHNGELSNGLTIEEVWVRVQRK